MALNIKRFLEAIGLVGNSSQTISSAGEIEFRSDLGKLSVHDGTSSDQILTENKAATIQNKNISGASNTITNIPNSATTATDANTASAIVARDAGGSFSATSISASLNGTATYAIGPSSGSGHGAVTLNGSNQFQSVAPSTAGNYLRSNGTDWAASDIQASDVPTLNQNTTGTAANITATSNSTLTTLPSLSLPGSQVTGNISGNAANVTGTVAIANGGTGQTSQTAAFNALSPLTTKGDIVVHSGTNNVRQAIGSDGQVLIADSAQTNGVRWTTLQQGSKNYISNSTVESNSTTGWSLSHSTLDSTSKLPDQASGSWTSASGNLAIATTSSGKLAGSYSLQLTQSTAASVAGDMLVTDAMTIDTEDQAKVMSFSFYYSATSGASNLNFSGTNSNSIGVAIYDVTNSTWIQPAGVFNLVQSSGVGLASGTFQTSSNGTQYRLAIYFPNASTGTGTFTMLIDDVVIGPSKALTAPALEDFGTKYTITPSSGFGSVSLSSIQSRRVGDSLQVIGSFKCGTVTGTTAYLQLPRSIDFTKLNSGNQTNALGNWWNATNVGGGANYSNSGVAKFGVVMSDGSTSNQVFLSVEALNNRLFQDGVSTIAGNNDSICFNFTVPIAGWSSDTVSSADTDTRVVAVTGGGTPTSSLTGSFSIIVWGGVTKDSSSSYNPSTGVYTVPVSGWYQCNARIITGGTAALNQEVDLSVFKNGSELKRSVYLYQSASAYGLPAISTLQYFNAGDTVDFRALSTATSPTYVAVSSAHDFSIERLSGPAVVQATESVGAKYTTAVAQSTPDATPTTIIWGTRVFDTHNAMNTSTGVYTVPVSGRYRIYSATRVLNQTTGGGYRMITRKNSSNSQIKYTNTVSGGDLTSDVLDEIQCNAGDTIDIQLRQNSSSSNTLNGSATDNYIIIDRIGN